MSEKTSTEASRDGYSDAEEESLLAHRQSHNTRTSSTYTRKHILALYASNIISIAAILALVLWITLAPIPDPTLSVYSPANSAIKYIPQQRFRGALFNKTEYMGYPTDATDKLWEDLYNFGTSVISASEAAKLPHPTLPIPGTHKYLVQLDIWHELHCLNDLRKLLYPDRFPGLDALRDENGVVDMHADMFLHWDHCVDSLRQVLMCHADVSPISFHVNVPALKGVFPRLATTHTCRDFSAVQDWAKEHAAGEWEYSLTRAEAKEMVNDAEFDQSPFEDIQFLYKDFPGDTWFDYWREHPEEARRERERIKEEFGIDV